MRPAADGASRIAACVLDVRFLRKGNGWLMANFTIGDRSAYVGDEAAARTLATPRVGSYENFYTRFVMKPSFESEFAKYKFPYPEGGADSFEYQIPQDLIFRLNQLTQFRTDIAYGDD